MAAAVSGERAGNLTTEITQYIQDNKALIRGIFETCLTCNSYKLIENPAFSEYPKYMASLTQKGCCVIQAQADNGILNGICVELNGTVKLKEYAVRVLVFNKNTGRQQETCTKLSEAFTILKHILETGSL